MTDPDHGHLYPTPDRDRVGEVAGCQCGRLARLYDDGYSTGGTGLYWGVPWPFGQARLRRTVRRRARMTAALARRHLR